mmetsp:Transcript_47328/g.88147  ORF Transcript_47328/g.88147 Transcript_47328/m.88147 type:complete len:159 (-) Transcript_47328:332-808(-)
MMHRLARAAPRYCIPTNPPALALLRQNAANFVFPTRLLCPLQQPRCTFSAEVEQTPELSAEEITELESTGRKIFGMRPFSPGCKRTGAKVLRKKLVGPLFYDVYYGKPFEDVLRKVYPDFLTEKEDRRKQKLAYLRRRGKGPPKKGQGKRALKGVKKK